MANSKQSDNLISQPKGTSAVAYIGRRDLRPSPNPDTDDTERRLSSGSDKRNTAALQTTAPKADPQTRKPDGVIHIKERYFTMLKKDLILRNPLRVMGYENDDILNT